MPIFDNERKVRVINFETKEPISDYPSIKKCAQALFGGTHAGIHKVKALCSNNQKTTYCDKLGTTITIKYID